MEGTSGRRAVWATAQYLSYAKPGETMDIDVTLAVHGHQITQARATCHVGDREILTVNAALGDRELDVHGQFETMPTGIPRPEECEERPHVIDWSGTISGRMDQRMAKGRLLHDLDGTPSDGQALLWSRIPEVIDGRDASQTGAGPFGAFVNACWVPAISIPAGLTREGLPVGLQIVARHHREDVLLRLARIAEETNPWGAPPAPQVYP